MTAASSAARARRRRRGRPTRRRDRGGTSDRLSGGRSEPLEPLDREDEDGRAADLDLERVGHEELAGLHDRWHRVDDLSPGRAVVADDAEDLLDPDVIDTDDDR